MFAASYLMFVAMKKVYGLRVEEHEERYGLDIVEHGMWGYPEAFMPVPGSEYVPRQCQQDGRRASRRPLRTRGWRPTRRRARRARSR